MVTDWIRFVMPALALALVPGPLRGAAPLEEETRRQFWSNPELVKRFMASYGVDSSLEPSFENPGEQAFYRELQDAMRDDPALAIERLQQRISPSSSAILSFALANLLVQEGEPEKAVEHFEVALAKFPDFRRAHRNLGWALAQLERYPEAARSLTRALQLGAHDAGVYGLLGHSYLSLGRNLLAESAYRSALLADPENHEWSMGMVRSLVARADYDQALSTLDDLLAGSPGSAGLWQLQARVALEKGDLDRAAVNYEMLRRMGEASAGDLKLLGDIYLSGDLAGMALPIYLEAIAKDGVGDIGLSLNAVEILVQRGAAEEAEQLIARIRELRQEGMGPGDEARLLRLESRLALAAGDTVRALDVLERIIDRNPMDGEALLLAGDCYCLQGDPARALIRFEMAARISGFEAASWRKQVQQLLVPQRKYPEALDLLERAQKLDPQDNWQKYYEEVAERLARAASG